VTEPGAAELRRELERTRAELREARARIAAMEMSSFWKLRNLWWSLKERLHFRRTGRFEAVPRLHPYSEPEPAPPPRRNPNPARSASTVDVVVCVHDALEDVRDCLDSVIRHSTPVYRLILVDDGSGAETRDFLASFASSQGALLIRNESARGYTLAANQGLRAARADHVVLLNSDTVVTREWLDRLVACAESDDRVGLAGPLSNCASWQSVPDVADAHGDWATNPLPDGVTPDAMAAVLARDAGPDYPRMKFLNGFCLLIRRQVMDAIGLFDEEGFGRGYGEENDYCLRARKAGFELALADDVYVLHRQSKSYSTERRKVLSALAGETLAKKHGQPSIDDGVAECRSGRVLEAIRERSRDLLAVERVRVEGRARWKGKRVLFVLPVCDRGGGANIVFSEALEMARMGVDVRILNLANFRPSFEKSYPEPELPVVYASSRGIPDAARGFDAVIATHNASVEWIAPLADERNGPVLGYYVQDYEPLFYPDGSKDGQAAFRSYTRVPGLVLFTKTEWNRDEVLRRTGATCHVVGPSFDQFLFRPLRPAPPSDRIRIAAMARPSSPRRQPFLTMDVLETVSARYGDRVEITVFGDDPEHPDYSSLRRSFPYTSAGIVDGPVLASLFNRVHVFVDFSTYQAMGLSALEAMGCGATAIVPSDGGASSFASHEENALVVDTSTVETCLTALVRLIEDHELRTRLMGRAFRDVMKHHPALAAHRSLAALFPGA
jgi:GT2 family glycosyltransferase/glycosyltransferase involved in cell wall biosynthesis